ncbi:MAG: hypothetical protein WCO58_01295 [bacterium]
MEYVYSKTTLGQILSNVDFYEKTNKKVTDKFIVKHYREIVISSIKRKFQQMVLGGLEMTKKHRTQIQTAWKKITEKEIRILEEEAELHPETMLDMDDEAETFVH